MNNIYSIIFFINFRMKNWMLLTWPLDSIHHTTHVKWNKETQVAAAAVLCSWSDLGWVKEYWLEGRHGISHTSINAHLFGFLSTYSSTVIRFQLSFKIFYYKKDGRNATNFSWMSLQVITLVVIVSSLNTEKYNSMLLKLFFYHLDISFFNSNINTV